MHITVQNTAKTLLSAAFFLLILFPLSAQKTAEQPDKQAEFPGGMPALMTYLSSNIQYPEAAKKDNAEGMIVVKFVVNKDGSIGKTSTVNNGPVQRPDFVKEALRVVKGMPKWIPAEKDGKKVKSEMALPIKFKLS